jgi:Ca-activated chloride channel family protein
MKTPRASASSSEAGLIAWLENTRVSLPLKGVECQFTVTGALACVQLDQIYHQDHPQPLDCTYTFPLPAGAAVYRCELHVNGRVIRAKVEEEAKARRIFKERKEAGYRAALVESERENIFTLALGNVQPGDVIVVRLAWFQMLDRNNGDLRLLVPTCLGVRYIPGTPLLRSSRGRGVVDDTDQVPDASRITPPRIDALHPDAAYFFIEGRLASADVESGAISSPTHAVLIREGDGAIAVELSSHGAVPDHDFVLEWRETQARQLTPHAWRWTEANATYALVELRAPEDVKAADDFSQDVYFLVDRSGSMHGAKWHCTCEALRAFVGLLGPQDRVWITLFESQFVDFAEAPIAAPQVLADRGFQKMEALGTAGGTELHSAAKHVLQQIDIHSADRHTSVVLITDGQVGDDEAIVRAFRKFPHVRVHTFGIDIAVNDAFLRALARQQRGGCWLQTPDDDIAGTIAALGHRLRRPVLTNLALGDGWQAGPDRLPDLCAQEIVTVALRSDGDSPIEITGQLPSGETHRLAIQAEAIGSDATKLLWAKERMDALLSADRPADAIALAREHNLICKGAAFVAWDEAERVQVAQEEIIQPAMEMGADLLCCSLGGSWDVGVSAGAAAAMPSSELRLFALDACNDTAHYDSLSAVLGRVGANIRKLRQDLQWAGIENRTLKALRLWVDSHGRDAARQLEKLCSFLGYTAILQGPFRPMLRALWEAHVRRALQGSPEALLKWPEEFGQPFEKLLTLILQWEEEGMPEELVNELVSAVLNEESINQELIAQLGNRMPKGPQQFSTDTRWRTWRKSIEETLGSDSKAYAAAMRCLPLVSEAAK